MKKIIGSLAVLSALFLSGCGTASYNQSAAPSTTPNTPASQNQPATGASAISIQNFAFSPETLTIKKGTTVTWTNNDSVTHTIKSATFNSGDLAKGATFKFTFDTAGTFNYSCGIHPSMTGKIIVE